MTLEELKLEAGRAKVAGESFEQALLRIKRRAFEDGEDELPQAEVEAVVRQVFRVFSNLPVEQPYEGPPKVDISERIEDLQARAEAVKARRKAAHQAWVAANGDWPMKPWECY